MLVASKFSKLYLAKPIFFILLGLFAILISSVNYFNERYKLQERTVMLVIGLIVFGVSIGAIIDIFKMYRLLVDEEKIVAQKVVSGKKEFFYYKDITGIDSVMNRNYVARGVPMNNGYFSRIYTMNDGRLLEVSPQAFENYGDLIATVSSYTSHLE